MDAHQPKQRSKSTVRAEQPPTFRESPMSLRRTPIFPTLYPSPSKQHPMHNEITREHRRSFSQVQILASTLCYPRVIYEELY
jgi:hypothetical protein